jgi:RPA family protein
MSNFNRQTARKVIIGEILIGELITENEQLALILENDPEGKDKIYRINLIGIIISKERVGSLTNLLIEDGSGKITLRYFEENKKIDELVPGKAVLIIGRVRIFNEEKYISPEISKIISPEWFKLRNKEMEERINSSKISEERRLSKKGDLIKNRENANNLLQPDGNEVEEIILEEEILPFQKISKIIKDLDQGNGAVIEEIIDKSTMQGTEKIIEKMMEMGEIFQNMPGRVKIL